MTLKTVIIFINMCSAKQINRRIYLIDLWILLHLKLRRKGSPKFSDDRIADTTGYMFAASTSVLLIPLQIVLYELFSQSSFGNMGDYRFVLIAPPIISIIYYNFKFERNNNWKKIETDVDIKMNKTKRDKIFFWMGFVYFSSLFLINVIFWATVNLSE